MAMQAPPPGVVYNTPPDQIIIDFYSHCQNNGDGRVAAGSMQLYGGAPGAPHRREQVAELDEGLAPVPFDLGAMADAAVAMDVDAANNPAYLADGMQQLQIGEALDVAAGQAFDVEALLQALEGFGEQAELFFNGDHGQHQDGNPYWNA